jgi:hypothetical protein
MKNATNYLLFVMLTLLLCASCGPTLYVPNAINTPLLKEAGDAKLAVGAHLNAREAVDLQSAYAVTDHFAIMVNADYSNYIHTDIAGARMRNRFGEAAIGWYSPFHTSKDNTLEYRAEMFAGFGLGKSEDITSGYNPYSYGSSEYTFYNAHFNRYFLQPSAGFKSDIVDLAFSMRFAYIDLHNWNQRPESEIEFNRNEALSFGTLEPGLTLGVGYKGLKLYMQSSIAIPVINEDEYHRVTADSFWMMGTTAAIGIQYTLK